MQTGSEKRRGHQATLGVTVVPRVKVLLPLPLAGAYDYRVPASMSLNSGDFVVVPLNHRDVIGVVWDSSPEQETVSVLDQRLRRFPAMLAPPPMTASLRRFVDWVAAYTLSPPGAV